MDILPVKLHQFRVEVLADGGEDAAQIGQHLAGEYTTSVFGHKDQVNMQVKNAMPTMPYLVCIGHRPSAIGQANNKTMLIRKAVRYRLEPLPEREHLLSRAVGCVRFVWNRALSVQKSYLEHGCGLLSVLHCQRCGHEAHADVNAAQNILARGLRPAKGLHPAGGLQSTAGHAGVVCSPAQAGELPETKGNQAIKVAEVRPLLAERNPRPSRSQERQP